MLVFPQPQDMLVLRQLHPATLDILPVDGSSAFRVLVADADVGFRVDMRLGSQSWSGHRGRLLTPSPGLTGATSMIICFLEMELFEIACRTVIR